jgi:hypothetical protein
MNTKLNKNFVAVLVALSALPAHAAPQPLPAPVTPGLATAFEGGVPKLPGLPTAMAAVGTPAESAPTQSSNAHGR